ncbi:MAG TPA: tRNA (adenosine(37)-N6)-threonylcarbamoyltransferase complex transferase subunit TsaD [Burkholderiales bacterium]|nr:tRNA (adenosine(37)-N6)-threonylcarbamoyltransferase complex transferase subunit TsaD [Burkholderiales bacterium]
MLTLGIETSCDETGIALYDSQSRELFHVLHSQTRMHDDYGGVVPELASRDHIRRVVPLIRKVLGQAERGLLDIDAIAYTRGPGLAGALLVGASIAESLAYAIGKPAIGIHHLEAHLLSPLLVRPAPEFPFIALLVSGGHTQLLRADAVGRYALLGETLDDAAGEAFDKAAKLLGLSYPGGPALAKLALEGSAARFKLPRPMARSGDLNFSFSGLKTAVLHLVNQNPQGSTADIAAAFQEAVVDVLVAKSLQALRESGLKQLVVVGGVGANARLRERLLRAAQELEAHIYFPPPELCTDNGAMIAFAGALRLEAGFRIKDSGFSFNVHPRWEFERN